MCKHFKILQGNENGGGKNGLNGQSNTTDTVNVGSDELSQLKESFSTENQQENGGGSTALEVSLVQLLYAWLDTILNLTVLEEIMSVVANLYSFFSTNPSMKPVSVVVFLKQQKTMQRVHLVW